MGECAIFPLTWHSRSANIHTSDAQISTTTRHKGTKTMNTTTRTYEIEMSKGYSGKAAVYEKGWIA